MSALPATGCDPHGTPRAYERGDTHQNGDEAPRIAEIHVGSRRVVVEITPKLALSVAEACAAIGVNRDTFDSLVLPSQRVVRLGRRILVPAKNLDAWLDRHSAVPPAKEAG